MLRIAILLAALAAGGVAAWMALAVRGQPAAVTVAKPPPPPVQDVLVASADLGLGEALTKETMRWQSWPESALNPAYITRSARPDALQALAGRIVRNRMPSNEPIRDENLVPPNTSFLSARLPSGKRAAAVPISAQSTAGGFILPNDRVDVILTVAQEKSEPVSRAILRNVLVLAIDQIVDEQNKDELSRDEKGKDAKGKDEKSKDAKGKDDEKGKAKAPAVVGKTATLELDPSQVEVLTAAERTGTLSLALRSAADNGEEPPMRRTRTVKFYKVGTMEVVDITASGRSVEIVRPRKRLGPALTPRQIMASESQ